MKIMLDHGAVCPTRAHDTDAGLDVYAMDGAYIAPYGSALFHTGVHVELPKGCAGLLVSKSGLNVAMDITSTGLIDEGYSGEIMVKLYNHGPRRAHIGKGQKISQLVIIPVRYENIEIVPQIAAGERGENGFGSSGR